MITHPIRKLAALAATAAMLAAGAPAMAARAGFTDVAPGAPHYDDIMWVDAQGISRGYPDHTFGGMRDVVRQDMAAFLYRLAGSPEFDEDAAQRANTLTDVHPGVDHYREVLWLTSTGITQGYPDHTFGGMRTVVRQDMAAFLHRYADNVLHAAQPDGQAKAFTDVAPGATHYDDIMWLSRTGITTGFENGTFGGMRTVVRQDMAAFLHRTHDNLKTDNGGNKPNNGNKPDQPAGVKVRKVVTATSGADNYAPTLYAIGDDGSLWAWGRNDSGQIGDGTTNDRTSPYQVPGLPKVKDTVVRYYGGTVYVIGEDGSLWAWGDNDSGQVGDGTTNDRTSPYQVPGLPKVASVSFTFHGTVHVIGEDGSLWAWGDNFGQIGDGTTENRTTPVRVSGLPKVKGITTDGFDTVYAIGADGSLWAWGGNYNHEVGDGTTDRHLSPVRVSGLPKVTDVVLHASAASNTTVFAIGEDGSLWAWGSNTSGEVGDGTTTDRAKPVKVSGLPGVSRVSVTFRGTVYALGEDGSLWAWGSNDNGTIGDGTTQGRTTPVQVPGLPKVTDFDFTGGGATYATGADGSLWSWGLGGGATGHASPVQVSGLPKVANVVATGSNVYVIGGDGSFWTWRFGRGFTEVSGLPKVTGISTDGGYTTYAVGGDGSLWTWKVDGTPSKVEFRQ